VSRHGYRFVFSDLVEEDDASDVPVAPAVHVPPPAGTDQRGEPYEPLLEQVTSLPGGSNDEEAQREAAEMLHALDTAEALRRLGRRPHHTHARALLRDTRWDTAEAGPVPILGQPGSLATARELVALRLRRSAAIVAERWAGASAGAGLAGLLAGAGGGLALAAVPGSAAPLPVVPVLAFIGAICGAAAGAGVGAGLAVAEPAFRSRRALGLIAAAAIGGGFAGLLVQWLGRWTLAALVGVDVAVGGGLEGLVIGAAAGLGYGLATPHTGGWLAAPRGRRRAAVAAATSAACGLAALGLALTGRPLVGGTVHLIAAASAGSQALLTPLGRIIGEPDFGPVTASLISLGEGASFGLGLALGLTRRRRLPDALPSDVSRTSHPMLTSR
jgi:hypothetical protein